MEYRTIEWIDGGVDRLDAAQLAMDSIHDDLLHHGEIRGVEVKIIDIVISEIDASNIAISFNMGVTDDSSTLQTEFDFTISA